MPPGRPRACGLVPGLPASGMNMIYLGWRCSGGTTPLRRRVYSGLNPGPEVPLRRGPRPCRRLLTGVIPGQAQALSHS